MIGIILGDAYPTITPTRNTPTITLTPTQPPTRTPTPMPPTPTPRGWRAPSDEIGLGKNRQWFVFVDSKTGQIGGFNVDGTGLTWYDLPAIASIDACYRCQMKAYKNLLAYATENTEYNTVDLVVARFPEGEVVSKIPIASTDYDGRNYILQETIGLMAWSPDGKLLAISAAPNRPNTDIHLYRLGANYIEQLSSEEGYIWEISWGEDNQTLIFTSIIPSTSEELHYEFFNTEWMVDLESSTITEEETYGDYGGGCGGDASAIYVELYNSDRTIKIIFNTIVDWDFGYGVFIQTEEDEAPRLLFRPAEYYHTLLWLEPAQRFIIGTEAEYIILREDGSVDFRSPIYNYDSLGVYPWRAFTLSPDGKYAALISSSGLLKIYELDDGFHEIWTVPEPAAVDIIYWFPNRLRLIVEGLGNFYHVDVEDQAVSLLINGGAQSFSMDYGFWMSQE